MKILNILMLILSIHGYAQNKTVEPSSFKGDHFAIYSKCFSAIAFCEMTQQAYQSCGSSKNCYGLFVMPGDTFYINIEDKLQYEVISADVSFGGYFPALTNVIFKPIDNNCVPQQALRIAIPLLAIPGSSFQIEAQNLIYVNNASLIPSGPVPFFFYVGGPQPQFTFALSDFTVCLLIDYFDTSQVSVAEVNSTSKLITILPNPSSGTIKISIENYKTALEYRVTDLYGNILKFGALQAKRNSLELNLALGLYLISFYLDDHLIETRKIIVSN